MFQNLEKARERANLELRHVLPEFVITYIDENLSSNYSSSRKNCGIVFFYVDFFEHYSEVLKNGLEWVELLNELICDFDNLLLLPKYSCIFKIKTISSTYMAASNLAPGYKLMNWKAQAVKLMEVLHATFLLSFLSERNETSLIRYLENYLNWFIWVL